MKEQLLAEKTNILQLLTSERSSPRTKVVMSRIFETAEQQDIKNEKLLE